MTINGNFAVPPEGTHLDNAGSSLMPKAVINTIRSYMDREAAVGGYRAADEHKDQLDAVYQQLADGFGGHKTSYALSGGGADAFAKLFYSVPIGAGDNIITSQNEYCSNYLAYLHRAEICGFEVRIAPFNDDGQIDLDSLESLIDDRTRLVSLSHNTATSGVVLPAREIGRLCKQYDILYLLDATQTVGHLELDFADIGCDMATGTARKWLRGPRGLGFMYLAEAARERISPAMIYNQSGDWLGANAFSLRSDARVLESWERSCGNQLGLGAALNVYQSNGPAEIERSLFARGKYLRDNIANMKSMELVDPGAASSAIVTCNVKALGAADAKKRLAEGGFHVGVALKAQSLIDFEKRGIESALRISPHYYTSMSELDSLLIRLEDMTK